MDSAYTLCTCPKTNEFSVASGDNDGSKTFPATRFSFGYVDVKSYVVRGIVCCPVLLSILWGMGVFGREI